MPAPPWKQQSAGLPPWQQQAAPAEPSFTKRLADAYVRGRQQLQPIQQQALSDLASPGKAVGALNDMARIAADTATFGFADPAISAITGQDERARTQEARERAGWAGTGMDVATAVAATPSLASRVVGGGVKKALGYGAEAGAQAALSSYGHGETDPSTIASDALLGSALGAGGSTVGGWAGRLKARRAASKEIAKAPIKTKEQAFDASDEKYRAVRDANAVYPGIDVAADLQTRLDDALMGETLHPRLDASVLDVRDQVMADLSDPNGITPEALEKTRRWVKSKLIKGPRSDEERAVGGRMLQAIDDFTGTVDVTTPTGPSAQVSRDLAEGRELWGRGKRTQRVQEKDIEAKTSADTTGSAFNLAGGNLENRRRQLFRQLAERSDQGKLPSRYTGEERELLEGVVRGSGMRNLGRSLSNISPLRGGLPAILHGVAAGPAAILTGGSSLPWQVAALAGGEAGGYAGRKLTDRAIKDLETKILTGVDPRGDPATVNELRDLLARLGAGAARAQ